MPNKNWIIAEKKTDDIVDQLLINRKIDLKDKEVFLNPDYQRDILDPFLLPDMDKATKRIIKALKNKEKIGIFTDFDADGISAGAILFKVFKLLDLSVEVYIPTRDEGYGLSLKGLKELKEKKCGLIITTDLGIANKKEIQEAKKWGLDVIVCDHHEIKKDNLPTDALALLHPQLAKKYPNKYLSGGGVAWKLAQALVMRINTNNGESTRIQNFPKWTLDLAAISTICDIVPLVGENRVIVKYGLIVLNKTKNIGLKAIYQSARIQNIIDTYSVGFIIGPRINAPGRINNASSSFYLLVSDDTEKAQRLAQELEKANRSRQSKLEKVLSEAKKRIKNRGLDKKKVIVVEGNGWPLGLIGLIAGKLMDQYSRPVLVFSQDGKKLKGSARSTEKFHLLEALSKAEKYLIKHGGHARAAGITMESKHLKSLYDTLLAWADKKLSFDDLNRVVKIDVEISLENIDFKLVKTLNNFEPFGLGNPRPVFLAKDVEIVEKRTVGTDNQHLKLKLKNPGNKVFDSIGFDLALCAKELTKGEKIDIVFTVDEDNWNGNKKIQLKILDLEGGKYQ